jgi:hypothetical protein
MSDIKWCDTGNHAFPYGRDNDEREYSETRERQGRRQVLHTCGPCFRKSTDSISAAALGAAPTVVNGE